MFRPSSTQPSNHQSRQARTRKRFDRRPNVERLEARRLLATIAWSNRGTATSDSDGFGGVFGNQAELARNVVAAAIASWERVIVNFNYGDHAPAYQLQVNMASNGTSTAPTVFRPSGMAASLPPARW